MSTSETTERHVYVVLDRSGSMSPLVDTVVVEYNRYVEALRQDQAPTKLTLVLFDSNDAFEIVHDHLDVHDVPILTTAEYVPGAGTPLYDAVGHTIDLATRRLKRHRDLGESPEIHVAVITDGEENDSTKYDRQRLYGKVRRRTVAGWQFTFMGAVHNAFEAAAGIGIEAGDVVPWETDDAGTRVVFATLAERTIHRPAKGARRRGLGRPVDEIRRELRRRQGGGPR